MKRSAAENELVGHLVKGGTTQSIAEVVAREILRLSAIHLQMCIDGCNRCLEPAEEDAKAALERQIKSMGEGMPGVASVEFGGDPRTCTVTFNLASGESNSFTGRGWKITVDERDMKNLGDYWDDYLNPQHEVPDYSPSL